VRGKAHESYAGKVVRLYSFGDYVTNTPVKESQDTIEKDGFFELIFHTECTRPVFLKIENVTAQMYVQPDFVYGITIPEVEKGLDYKNDAELPVNIGIVGNDSTELNALIFDYQALYNKFFIPSDNSYLSRAHMFKLADSLRKVCDTRYAGVHNMYFKNYVNYSIASINASVSRGENYLINGFISGKPVLYEHYEYMQFFQACFKGYLNTIAAQHKGRSLYNIINVKASYAQLRDFLKEDQFVKSDTLKELVILKNLWDFYFSPEFDQKAIENIVSQLSIQTHNAEHRKICNNMRAFFSKMQVGSVAPDFSARSKDGKMASLSSYKGRWVYLNFFSTSNTESLKEMAKIATLKKKYGDKVTFISVCVDDSLNTYTSYLRANPKYDWMIWYNNAKGLTRTAKENYNVSGTEAYFLISNQGYLAMSPAMAPSAGIEYRFNLLFRIKQRNTRTGLR
jgi:hypothetical protein